MFDLRPEWRGDTTKAPDESQWPFKGVLSISDLVRDRKINYKKTQKKERSLFSYKISLIFL